ncbi:nuclease-related domain-containing protein [Anabaena lutea]|uniref:NERD domain-containing protein n=1 Tax=Anabaena lutea FACHB-196 TaxID=2692881 RepID=A0ABR8F9W0_9NOST|nr:nuclease-related domain-containing protein [Anabaena lutea]MBD2566997.1 NERD domain-containing protein [Anabaena lutea FACHB-196]
MRTLKQSPVLREKFQQQVDGKKSVKHQEVQELLGNGFLGSLGAAVFEIKQFQNQLKGNAGEWSVSLLLKSLPDSWVMFNNALIPTSNVNTLTEIDLLIIGAGGIFLVEVKTWKGSFTAYKDKWKRREGNNWEPISDSPTSQSIYHQRMFSQWVNSLIPNLPNGVVKAPVIFPVAKWLGVTDCSVPVLQGIPALLQMIVNSTDCLTPMQVQVIAEAVEDLKILSKNVEISKPISKPKLIKRENFKD